MKMHGATKHSKLYQGVYWGAFEYNPETDAPVVHRRNRFAEEMRLSRALNNRRTIILSETLRKKLRADHVEVYLTECGKLVVLSSPYEDVGGRHDDWGFQKVDPLYCAMVTTYVQMFDGVKELDAWVKELSKWTFVTEGDTQT